MKGGFRRYAPALRIFVWSRLGIWALALAAFLSFEGRLNPERIRWDTDRLHELGAVFDVWARWDSDWYLKIAEEGYSWPSGTPAFFPLYPAITAAVGRVFAGSYLLAGLLVSLAFAATAFVLLYRLALPCLGEHGARRAVLYLALFPTSLFLGAVYGESLFLTLALASFVLAERERFCWAGGLGGLAILTRPAGVALLLALAAFAWRSSNRRHALAGVAIAPLLFLAYPLALWITVGHPFAFLDAQDIVWGRELSPLGPVGGVVAALQDVTARNLLDLLAAVAIVAAGIAAWRRLGVPYGLYALASALVPLSAPSERFALWSMQRFALVVFPLFLVLAHAGRRRALHLVVVTVFAAWLAIDVLRWALWYWVA